MAGKAFLAADELGRADAVVPIPLTLLLTDRLLCLS